MASSIKGGDDWVGDQTYQIRERHPVDLHESKVDPWSSSEDILQLQTKWALHLIDRSRSSHVRMTHGEQTLNVVDLNGAAVEDLLPSILGPTK